MAKNMVLLTENSKPLKISKDYLALPPSFKGSNGVGSKEYKTLRKCKFYKVDI